MAPEKLATFGGGVANWQMKDGGWGASLPQEAKPQGGRDMSDLGLNNLGSQLASSIKDVIISIVDFLTPIITVVAIGMILVGVILYALRQEFYGLRLIIGGAVALAIVYLGIPIILGYL